MSRIPSADEIVSVLKHSSLPTILVEGKTDMQVFSLFEKLVNASVLPCGKRDVLFEVLERKEEFSNIPCVFLADRDMWYFTGIPSEFKERVVFTEGYSIENDIVCGSGFVERFLSTCNFRQIYDGYVGSVSEWWAFIVGEWEAGNYLEFAKYPIWDAVECTGEHVRLNTSIVLERYSGYNCLHDALYERIKNEFEACFHGHLLVSLYNSMLNSHPSPLVKKQAGRVISTCLIAMESPKIDALVDRVFSGLWGGEEPLSA